VYQPLSCPAGRKIDKNRQVALKTLVAAFAVALVITGCTSGNPIGNDHPSAGDKGGLVDQEISVSALSHGGAVKCTATFPFPTIAPGAPTGVRFTVENISEPGFSISEGAGNGQTGYLIERSSTGTLIQNTSHMHDGVIGGAALPHRIRVGSSTRMPAYDAPVLYPGVIEVTPVCPLTPTSLTLPPVRLEVSAPGRAPAAEDAIRRAVAAAGPAFSGCAPTRDQEWVMGTSRTTAGTPFSARCGALVLHNRRYVVVLLGIVSPPRAPAIDLDALASQLGVMKTIRVQGAVAVSVWRFVVTTEAMRLVNQFAVAQNCEGTSYHSGSGVASCRFPTER
jgi:hypothetical protein